MKLRLREFKELFDIVNQEIIKNVSLYYNDEYEDMVITKKYDSFESFILDTQYDELYLDKESVDIVFISITKPTLYITLVD